MGEAPVPVPGSPIRLPRRFPSVKDLSRRHSQRSIDQDAKKSNKQEKIEREREAKTKATAVLDYGSLQN